MNVTLTPPAPSPARSSCCARLGVRGSRANEELRRLSLRGLRSSGARRAAYPLTRPQDMGRPATLLVTLAFGLICLIWGTTWAVIQIGLRGTPPLSGVAIRFAIAATLLLGVARTGGVEVGRTRKGEML